MNVDERLTEEQRRLVEGGVELAAFLAKMLWEKNTDQMDLREVTSVAFQGLVSATLKWDPETYEKTQETLDNGKAFGAFARRRIIGAVIDYQRRSDHVPRRQRRTYKDLQERGLGNGRSHEQLAEITGLDLKKIRAITHAVEATSVSLDTDPQDWEGGLHPNEKAGSHNVESSALENALMEAVVEVFQSLPPLEQGVVALRYYQGHELPAIAALLGVRLSVVREAHSEAILRIHEVMLHHAS